MIGKVRNKIFPVRICVYLGGPVGDTCQLDNILYQILILVAINLDPLNQVRILPRVSSEANGQRQ